MLHSQHELKEKMIHTALQLLQDDELTVISFTDNVQNIYWENDNKNEFSFNGEIYDLVRTERINGRVIFYCFNDKKEQQLIDLSNSLTKNSDAGRKTNNNVFPSITLFILENSSQISFSFEMQKQFGLFAPQLSEGMISNTAPPPKS